MSKLYFTKYHATGNDFIFIDDRAHTFDVAKVKALCHRKCGVGADGVILLQESSEADFRMRIYNCDGTEADSCGNGLLCLMKFIEALGFPKQKYRIAMSQRVVEIQCSGEKTCVDMGAATNVKQLYICPHLVHFLDTGVPHAVVFAQEPLEVWGPLLQSHPFFQPAGTNVNVAQGNEDGSLSVRVYERGVGETLSCGTGAAAVGWIAHQVYRLPSPIRICFPGGTMQVAISQSQITLIGDPVRVFEGHLNQKID